MKVFDDRRIIDILKWRISESREKKAVEKSTAFYHSYMINGVASKQRL